MLVETNGDGTDDNCADKGPFVLRLRGLPWEATQKDIAAFLSPVVKEEHSAGEGIEEILVITGSQVSALTRLPRITHLTGQM